MEEVREINNNYRIEIQQDKHVESPDSWGNEKLFLVFDHRQFNVEREGFEPDDIYNYIGLKRSSEQLEKNIRANLNNLNERDLKACNYKLQDLKNDLENYKDYELEYFIFNVSAYIHSGVSLSLNTLYPFNCPWDTAHNGFILVKKDIKEDLTIEEAHKYAQGLIETWNQYLSGEVYYIELQLIRKYTKCYLDSGMDSEEFIEYETIDSMGEVYRSDLESCIQDLLNSNNIIKMKQPENILPFHIEDKYRVLDKHDYLVADLSSVQDTEYVTQACNNFPKAIELLEQCKVQLEHLNSMEEKVSSKIMLCEINAFLKIINKD